MADAVIYVVTCGLDIGSPITAALSGRGARVAWLSDGSEPPVAEIGNGVTRFDAGFGARAELELAFTAARDKLGPPTQVIISALPLAALQPQDIVTLDDEAWRASCSAAMKGVLYALQASFTQMEGRGGSVVVVGPSLSLAGAPRLVALSTAVEGQRGLVKSTARQWGQRGITVNWVAASALALSPRFDGLPLPSKADAVMVALGRPLSLGAEITPVIEFLGSPAGRVMTGATLLLDGGEWMLP
ncbi:SDR family oxidoreductase [Aquabacterium sp.]|uniref:SDR family oxidoreductase n=1 Tax=Aquabacterium sp. TaxID=1872578 RepID=UPI002CC63F9F|nr:SDR family oxidoreductase [Aquabacterium sp.]HSW03572.1 SDR family oxidoreductase [Aquabacterium sp.]